MGKIKAAQLAWLMKKDLFAAPDRLHSVTWRPEGSN